ncbi:hypothetical protein SMKI_11G0630 [Saccharomyces mikatae IFO 1815]|uniref:40S ribosomal protein S27 n=2 Tax=Saccharomycetaceae TaxID=4893 RepID=A0AA35IPP0_SACMI|nr:uncharacterized protein SMKI_11G0630 [Saccharomyces mikatae IFO 1815]CAI4034617.1 hypothetical protein SMKI_11G0630 [Saccharomyces mikatae IFO 1815]
MKHLRLVIASLGDGKQKLRRTYEFTIIRKEALNFVNSTFSRWREVTFILILSVSDHLGAKVKKNKIFTNNIRFIPFHLQQVLVQDLLHPTAASEARKHKLKTLVQGPRSYFLDVKCPGCLNITTVFSHAQTAVTCESCSTVLCTPTGGKAKLSEGTSFRRK